VLKIPLDPVAVSKKSFNCGLVIIGARHRDGAADVAGLADGRPVLGSLGDRRRAVVHVGVVIG